MKSRLIFSSRRRLKAYADQAFATAEFQRLKSGFSVQLPLGLAAIREWPQGNDQPGDVDSGPVILFLDRSKTP